MGRRIESWDDHAQLHWAGGTWTDLHYYGKGSVDMNASHYQSGDVKLLTLGMGHGPNGFYRTQIKSIKLGISAYGVLVDAFSTRSNIDVYGLGWVDLTVRGSYGGQTIKASSPGEVKVRTGAGNDAVSINMGGRYTYIDVHHGDDRIWLSTGIETIIDKGIGSLEVSGSAYRSGWTNIKAANLQGGGSIDSSSYGNWIVVQKASQHIKLNLYGLEANYYELKSGNANHTIRASSPGYNKIITADGNDDIEVDIGGRSTEISSGNGHDKIRLNSGVNTTIKKGQGILEVSGSAYRSGWTNIEAVELTDGSKIQSSTYGNWVTVNRANGTVTVDMYGLEANRYAVGSGTANHKINVSSPGYNSIVTVNGDDRIQIDMGGRDTNITTGNGNDSILLSSGIQTTINKGDGSLQVTGSAYRAGWTNLSAGNLNGGASIQSSSYGNWVIIDRASKKVRIDMYGLEANHVETRSGTADHQINVSSPGYNEIFTADGNDSIQVDMGGRKTTIKPGNGHDWIRVVNGIDVNLEKGHGSLNFSQDAYLSGVVQVKSETSRTIGESRSYGLRLEVNDNHARDQSGRWHGYALNWANVFLDTGSNAFYGSFFGGSWGAVEAKGQNYVQMTALQNTVIKDKGGNNFFTTGVQYGAVTVWTSVSRESAGATTIDMLGQKLDVYNRIGAGNQFLINNGGIVGALSFARSGNGLIYGQFGADLSESISLGQNSNYLYNAKNRKTSFTLSGSRNEIVDMGASASYLVSQGTQNAAFLSRGSIDLSQTHGSTVHVTANMTTGATVTLGKSSSLEIHSQIDFGQDAKYVLYRSKGPQSNLFELYCESLDVTNGQSATRKLLSFTVKGSDAERVTLKLGLTGGITLTDLNNDSTNALPSLGNKSSFRYVNNGVGPAGTVDFDLTGFVSAQQRGLAEAWSAKSLLTLPGLAGSSAISNGNFSRGIVDFTSDYVLNDDPLSFKGQGTATLTTLAPNWGFPTREGPSGAGSTFLVVDGSTEAGKSFWSTGVIGLKPGATYAFNFSMITGDYNPPNVALYVNGAAAGTANDSRSSSGWTRHSINFIAPLDGGKTRFDLKNLVLESGGNDFGIGNISVNVTQHVDGHITNGGFELGMKGFSSMYQNRTSPDYDPKLTIGTYAFVKKFDKLPSLFGVEYATPASGVDDVLWVSGGSDSNIYFWKKSLSNLVSGDEYLFSFKMLGNDNNPPKLVLDVNGVQQSPTWSVSKAQGWVTQATFIKVPKGVNHLELGMRDLVTERAGNDFAIDDISVTKSTGASDYIVNGDFESEHLGFASEYTKGNGTSYGEGKYAIVETAPGWELGASKGAGGKGKFLMVDGSSSAEKHFWKTSLSNLKAGDEYIFSFKMMANDYNPARLKLDVNGASLSQTWTASRSDGWVRHSVKIAVPIGTDALELGLRDAETQAGGNDFGIDDIEIVRNTRTQTDQGVSAAWIRGVRLFHAQSPEELGDVENMTAHQGFLLANNAFGIEVLKLLDASTISKLNQSFYANASAALLADWAGTDRLVAVTPAQIAAVPVTTVMELLLRGVEQKMSATTKNVAYGRVSAHLDGIDWGSTSPVNLSQLPIFVFNFMSEKSLTAIMDSKYFAHLPEPSKATITGQLTALKELKTRDDHFTGFTVFASSFSGLSREDLDSITNELSDEAIRKILDLKIPGWTQWAYGLPYTAITWQSVFYTKWILDLQKHSSSIRAIWKNGLSDVETAIRNTADPELRAKLLGRLSVLSLAASHMTDLTDTMTTANSLFQHLRFYASVYRLISAAGVLGVELQKPGQTNEELAFVGLSLAQTIASCLQVPTSFFTKSIINSNIPNTDLYTLSKWDDFMRFWGDKGLISTLSSMYDLRSNLLSSADRRLIISSYQSALKKMKADFDLSIHFTSHGTYTSPTELSSMLHDAAMGGKPSKTPTVIRIAIPNLVFQCTDLGSVALAIWGIVTTSKKLSPDLPVDSPEKIIGILSILQLTISAVASATFAISDAAGFAASLIKLGRFPVQAAKLAAIEAGGLQAAAVMGMIAHTVDYFIQSLTITKDNILAPVLGMAQSAVFLCLEAISLAEAKFAAFVLAFELLMPNFQAIVITAVMNDRIRLINEVGTLLESSPSRYRDSAMEDGYLGSCSVFKAILMLQRSQFDQMLAAAMPLGSIGGPIAMAAATTTLKNRIVFENDFSDSPGNFNKAYENFTKTVIAENNLFNILTSNIKYTDGMSGLIDWAEFFQTGGGKSSIQERIQSFADLYTHTFRFLLTIASGSSSTYPDGNAVSQAKYAVLSDLGLYTGMIKPTAPTHMYHEDWNLNKVRTIDLFAASIKMAEIDANIDPYATNIINFGFSGENIRVTTDRSASVNIEVIDNPANASVDAEHLYLGDGNFHIRVRENRNTKGYTVVHAGTGYSTLEGAQEMHGSDVADSIILANSYTKKVLGGAMKGDLLGFSSTEDLDTVIINDNQLTYTYLSRDVIWTHDTSFTNINNFVVANPTTKIDIAQAAADSSLSLLLAARTEVLTVYRGHAAVTTVPSAGSMRLNFYAPNGELALNSTNNAVTLGRKYMDDPYDAADEYWVSTALGNQFNAFYSDAPTFFELRPLTSDARSKMVDSQLSILGAFNAANTFTFDIAELQANDKPVQLHLMGSQNFTGKPQEDPFVDKISLKSAKTSSGISIAASDVHISSHVASNTSFTVVDRYMNDREQMLKISIGNKTIIEVYSVHDSSYQRFAAALADVYLDNNLLSHQIIG